ncbi:MAG TPA: class I SAM-dependent methyltransferase [Dehalococcoidia bacterium]|nr:class I SAM-dependent methyltransferase [Dehalococcoidia bacterium]
MIAQTAAGKQSHANADRVLRESKARRIESLLDERGIALAGRDVLDIGTGAGYIASYFAARARSLLSVDVVDERVVRDFAFQAVASETLPAADYSYDLIISNHVIEHVDDQLAHLREIARVLRADGVAYLATPNRFALLEPHFKLPLLSWLPASQRDRYVRLARRGARYDVQPLTYRELAALAREAGMTIEDRSMSVARSRLPSFARSLPMPHALRAVLPSFVVLLREGEK